MKRPATPFPELVAARWNIARQVPRAGGGLVTALVLTNLVLGVLPVIFVIMTAVVLGRVPEAVRGGLDSAAWQELIGVFVVAALVFLAQQVITPLAASLGELMARRVDGRAFDELMAASLGGPGVAPLEDEQVLNDLGVAARELEAGIFSPGQASAGLLALIARYTQLCAYIVVVGVTYSWAAGAGLLVAVLVFRYAFRGGLRKYTQVRIDLAGTERKSDYLRNLAVRPGAGKEIRVFGLVDWLREGIRVAYLAVLRPVWAERRRILLWPVLWMTLGCLALVALVFGGTGVTMANGLTLTGFILVMQSGLGALRLSGYYPEADVQTAIGMYSYEAVQRFTRRIEAYEEPAATAAGDPAPAHAGIVHFDNVSFRYPGGGPALFDGLDLKISLGRCTAIVGVNGAGKTTLVKLLARLYEPTGGVIRFDGVDIRSYPLDEWRARLGVIFQDYQRYEVSAADNIGFGSIAHVDDRPGIRAAAQAVGIAEALDELPDGMDTTLARHMTGGADLSGGQWQRVALARALFALRNGSAVVVLDEPTASLDVRAEAGFFDEFADLTRGATTLLISHRFSTVRHADDIVVLEHGRVTEQGGHEELLALDGRYAELFRLQADRFGDADDTDDTDNTGGTADDTDPAGALT
ncbi:ABC transporter ATP-binding protein [Streptosporangium carneum]|uniref:Multidrug ABC transporter permease n=1 Tax=Streptosporangium carneum TaxID=47481 RepID=A0A9W6I3H9_9ACTN|nr:ABC transporter ATP-binding protein [Streptosporangium carneum]GLK11385.1 multidrug ABC transporter permease [Streptosporangium carneum]